MASESEILIKLDFQGLGSINAIISRIKGPIIVDRIVDLLPASWHAIRRRDEIQMIVPLKAGAMKPTNEVKRGDVGFVPIGNLVVIYLADKKTQSKVNIIGNVTEPDKLDILTNIHVGQIVNVTKLL